MKKTDFIDTVKNYQGKIGMWEIIIDKLSMADFVLGCYYDVYDKKWKVYKNGERGMHSIRLSTVSEDEAYNKLLSMVQYQYKIINN